MGSRKNHTKQFRELIKKGIKNMEGMNKGNTNHFPLKTQTDYVLLQIHQ